MYMICLQGTVGLNLKYSLHMTNAKDDDILRHEFSADEFCTYHKTVCVTILKAED